MNPKRRMHLTFLVAGILIILMSVYLWIAEEHLRVIVVILAIVGALNVIWSGINLIRLRRD